MIEPADAMLLEIPNGSIKVSGFSSLLRSLQAAIRDTVGAPLLDEYNQQSGPFLVTAIATSPHGGATLKLWFADGDDRPLPETTHTAFTRFFRETETAMQRGDQRTFWGTPAAAVVAGDDSSRMTRFMANLRTFGTATLSYRNVAIELRNGAVRLTGNRWSIRYADPT